MNKIKEFLKKEKLLRKEQIKLIEEGIILPLKNQIISIDKTFKNEKSFEFHKKDIEKLNKLIKRYFKNEIL